LEKLVQDRTDAIAGFLVKQLFPVAQGRPEEETAEAKREDQLKYVLEDLKSRTRKVFNAIKTILLDEDFGLLAFHFSIVEGMRLALDNEVREGALKDLAFKHRRDIWPDESAFKLTEFYQKQNKHLDRVRENLN
jgi:hypothetical protein